jgi:pimeloyl-ACP methyl ester carboxylesterase
MNGRPPGSTAARKDHRDEWRVEVDGLAFRVLLSSPPGAGPGPAIVLVHGIGMSHRYLSRVNDVLAQHRAVYSIDLPGFGGLPKPGIDVGVAAMASALGGVIESLNAGPVVLVGHSMGAQWVVEVGAQRPELATDVVVIGPVADAEHRSLASQLIALVRDTFGETPAINAIVLTDYLRCGVPWYLAQVRHMLTYRIEDRVSALSMPLLVIRGSRDPIAGLEWCRRLRDSAVRARLVLIPGHHHVAQQSAPTAVAAAILAHVT